MHYVSYSDQIKYCGYSLEAYRWSASTSGQRHQNYAFYRNWYNQAPHLTQDSNLNVATSQLDITNESQEASPFPAGDHKAFIYRRAREQIQYFNNINDPQKKHQYKYFTGGLKPASFTAHQPHS